MCVYLKNNIKNLYLKNTAIQQNQKAFFHEKKENH